MNSRGYIYIYIYISRLYINNSYVHHVGHDTHVHSCLSFSFRSLISYMIFMSFMLYLRRLCTALRHGTQMPAVSGGVFAESVSDNFAKGFAENVAEHFAKNPYAGCERPKRRFVVIIWTASPPHVHIR